MSDGKKKRDGKILLRGRALCSARKKVSSIKGGETPKLPSKREKMDLEVIRDRKRKETSFYEGTG